MASTTRAWQYTSATHGLENSLQLTSVPMPVPKPGQHLVQVLYAALNPADYKLSENRLISYLMIPKPAIPGLDFCGRVVEASPGSGVEKGEMVYGFACKTPKDPGSLREYATVDADACVVVPKGLQERVKEVAGLALAGETAWGSIVPFVKGRKGANVFINGGSGGVGCMGIQIAKAFGCSVTTTCSTPNVDLCRSLGADQVIDYKTQDVLEALVAQDPQYDLFVDNVGSSGLFFQAHRFTKPDAICVPVGAELRFALLRDILRGSLPVFLGGMQRKRAMVQAKAVPEELRKMVEWLDEGKLRIIIDSEFDLDNVPDAMRRLKTGRARGKVIVRVTAEG